MMLFTPAALDCWGSSERCLQLYSESREAVAETRDWYLILQSGAQLPKQLFGVEGNVAG
jgi:hypothetical protein